MNRSKINKLIFVVSFLCLSALIMPSTVLNIKGILRFSLLVLASLAIVLLCLHKWTFFRLGKTYYDFLLLALLAQNFVWRWQASSRIARLAGKLNMPRGLFLPLVSLCLGILSVYSFNIIRSIANHLCKTIVSYRCDKKKTERILSVLFLVLLQFLMFEYGATDSLERVIQLPIVSLLANLTLLVVANLIVVLFVQQWRYSLIITTLITGLWAIADYYTIQFHGSPLYLSEFANAPTAAHVMLQYHYRLTGPVLCILLIFVLSLFFIYDHWSELGECSIVSRRLLIRCSALTLCLAASFFLFQHSISRIRPWMPWDVAIEESGFLVCTLRDAVQRLNPVFKPEEYDQSNLPQVTESFSADRQEYPDIILILNETFCDLRMYSEVETDHEFLEGFFEIDGAFYGKAIVPTVGGGTNNSEYELLACKSMYLLKSMAPFTYLDSEVLKRNAIYYLVEQGYSTLGMHCERAENYSRDSAYPNMGFQTVLLGPSNFSYADSNGNRKWLDAGNYKNMEEFYELLGDGPRFEYLLTFQNHGGYEQNDAALDTVHVMNDFGALTDDLNEYLSSIELSAKAFRELTEYYSKIDRKVIVCMVGDHAPSFITSLPTKNEMSFEESEIAKRTVPYVIWTNYGAEVECYTEYASMVDLLPMVMQTAGVPLTTFYKYILNMHEILPVRTSNGIYMDREGQVGVYAKENPYYDLVSQYYFMEYNSFLHESEYRSELFEAVAD